MTSKIQVVADASLLLRLIVEGMPYQGECRAKVGDWLKAGVRICVPPCWLSQTTAFLVRHYQGQNINIPSFAIYKITKEAQLRVMPFSRELAVLTVVWASRLLDAEATSPDWKAEYLALAERLDVELWTADHEFYSEVRDMHYVSPFKPEPEQKELFDMAWLVDRSDREEKEKLAKRIHFIEGE